MEQQFYKYNKDGVDVINKKIKYAKTDEGLKAFQTFYSWFGSIPKKYASDEIKYDYDKTCEKRKNGIFDEEVIKEIEYFLSNIRNYDQILCKIAYNPDTKHLLDVAELRIIVVNMGKELKNKYHMVTNDEQLKILNKDEKIKFLSRQIQKFYFTKSHIWQHENEYRLVTKWYAFDYIKTCCDKKGHCNLGTIKECLEEFKKKNIDQHYFLRFSNIPYQYSEPMPDGSGITSLINLPYPQKIFLGWDFKEEKKIENIKMFCKKHKVELFQLEQNFNHRMPEKFIVNPVSLD